ncbi:YybH family protein [Microbulbifer taiwanensis]|uniref:YybH family protein n=1 Tax=Microbulbifer taiwanensis TaxID=986746 RepID=A0ABW1YG63_9GAMM|nr:nuclear transport factor 2 family protein [Microbulbifer taiwanensis]
MDAKQEAEILGMKDAWYAALNAMLEGDPGPFSEIYSHAEDATYLSAMGSICIGWNNIWKDWQQQARDSRGGFTEEIESHIHMIGDVAVIHSLGRALLKEDTGAEGEHQVRETSVLHRDSGQWKIVAHHADALLPR